MVDDYYNIVLLPDAEFSKTCTEIAQDNFGQNHDGYCLEEGKVFPHVTLGQCRVEKQSAVDRILKDLEEIKLPSCNMVFPNMFFGYGYTGFEIKNNKSIQNLHMDIVSILKSAGLNPISEWGDNYFPHLTLAKVNQDVEGMDLISDIQNAANITWRLAFGHSDPKGQYLGSIKEFAS